MEKEFIPYEQALALKELGFNEPCMGYFDTRLEHQIGNFNFTETEGYNESVSALSPLYQQVFRWFREKHSLVHEISWSKYKGGLEFDYDIFSLVLPTDAELGDENDIASDKSMETYDSLVEKNFRHNSSQTYEEAELACLNKLIELVKEKP